jgi:ABC-type dipeptide/oligopeptide/nickel transport system permease component
LIVIAWICAILSFSVKGALPPLSGRYAAVRINIKENILPAFTLQPIAQRNYLSIVRARMA